MKRKRQRSNDEWPEGGDFDPGHWPTNTSVRERRERAEKAQGQLTADGQVMEPVKSTTTQISSSFWGRAWNRHLHGYSDYETRLPRGRSYLRSGCVLDLKIQPGRVEAKVQGSMLYEVVVRIDTLPEDRWQDLRDRCQGNIHSLLDLLQGRLDDAVMRHVTDPESGLFPDVREIKFSCTCPDWADLCKHVAAVLYGISVRLDTQPELLFRLRGVDHCELIQTATSAGLTAPPGHGDLADADLGALFDIDLVDPTS